MPGRRHRLEQPVTRKRERHSGARASWLQDAPEDYGTLNRSVHFKWTDIPDGAPTGFAFIGKAVLLRIFGSFCRVLIKPKVAYFKNPAPASFAYTF